MMFEAVKEKPAKMTSEIPAMTFKFDVSFSSRIIAGIDSSSVERSVLDDRTSSSSLASGSK